MRRRRGAATLCAAALALCWCCAAASGPAPGSAPSGPANRPPRFLTEAAGEIILKLKEGNETPANSLIYRLRGMDPDGDPLIFGVKGQEAKEMLRIENFGRNEANLYLRKELDRELKDEYSFVLTLTDGNLGEGNFVTQGLLLLVDDINDNEPIFRPFQSTINIPENARPGLNIATVEAVDRDEGLYGQVVYYIQELEGDDDTFSINTIDGKGVIVLKGSLDYEKKFLYQIRVLAVDRSNDYRVNSGTAAILVKVDDVEDQPPEFNLVNPVTRVREDMPIGSPVLQVKAVDGDRGINNKIKYSITKGPQDLFGINVNSGIIYTLKTLDRESPYNSNGAYVLEIMAQEVSKRVSPAPTAKTEVTVIILDVNDEVPTFRSKFYVAEVNENAQANTPVTFLGGSTPQVFDHDQGSNGTFLMYIDGDGGVFEVTPQRGVNEAAFLIRVQESKKLDYEKVTVMNFTLVAKEIVPNRPKRSVVPVTVYIRDMNDNIPEFLEDHYEATVAENCGIGTTVAWVQAMDKDSGVFGTHGIRYTNLEGSVAKMLRLDELTGVITTGTNGPIFDRELVSKHYLTVEARDHLGQGNRNTVQLTIHVEDVNDNAPKFTQNKYEARLMENQDFFDLPLVIEAYDADLNGTKNSNILYSIVGGDPDNNFTVNAETGAIWPTKPLDFESIQGKSDIHEINLVIRAQDQGNPPLHTDVPLIIYLLDMNDHGPVFEKSHYQRAIYEDMSGGTSILQVKAWDNDGSAPNNFVVYRIEMGAEDKFVIDPNSGVVSVAPGANLDPDRTSPRTMSYSLRVIALDGGTGTQQHTAAVPVEISIIDVNNKPPSFEGPATVRIMENAPIGRHIWTARATDPDDDPILRYWIDWKASEVRGEDGVVLSPFGGMGEYNTTSLFELTPIDGFLKVAHLLDREKVEVIKLVVGVQDTASTTGPQTASTTLTIIIDDENDNNPKFRKAFYRRAITENSKNGVTIATVRADDADKNRTITYSLEGHRSITELVHLHWETGEIVVANKIDREVQPWLNFSVKATDSGIPSRSSLAELYVQVLDENDNNPYFIGDISNVTVREDAPLGTTICVIEARDADIGDYGKVTYLLDRRSSQGKFQIDPETGELSVADTLNREEQNVYVLIIEAWDNYQFGYTSGESRNAFKQIGINIVDVNDETPEIDIPEGCATVTEFHNLQDDITVVRGRDGDDPYTPNGQIVFSIIDGNAQGLFRIKNIDHLQARVTAATSLRGLYGNYTLTIKAEDLGTPPNFVIKDLPICVTDFNDNPPKFISPVQNFTVRVPENATVGSTVIQVQALDKDIGLNGEVRYRLKQDPMGHWKTFRIDDVTGVITLKHPLDRERQKMYEVRVEAYDLGIPTPLSSDLDLTVYVKNINDYEPQFLVDEFTVNFTEHVLPGMERRRILDTVDQDDVDELDEPQSTVCYFIAGGNDDGMFALDPISHYLMVEKELDREDKEIHILVIKATEECHTMPENVKFFDPEDDTYLRVIVMVTDINDNSPFFLKKVFTGGVSTNADFGNEFMVVKAYDNDKGENAVISYHIFGGIQQRLAEGLENIWSDPFIVDKYTGGIFLNFDPQKGMKGYFEFMVLANDTDGLYDTAKVLIYLLREDQRLKFVLRQHPPEVREKIDAFREILGNVTGTIVNADEYKVHENQDGSVDKTKTDLYLHFVEHQNNSIMEVDDVLKLVDHNIEQLDDLFKDFNVLDTQPAEIRAFKDEQEGMMVAWLAGSTLLLTLLLILTTSLCIAQRSRYQRQLKAATATAFGSNDSDINRGVGRVPNTNKHSVEGSNPIWMQAYENEWYKEDDSLSRTSARDSLDENAVVNEDEVSFSHDIKPCFGQLCIYGGTCTGSNAVQDLSTKEQNDLNRSGAFHQNLYQHLDKVSNPLIAKKLETTEL
ncbi:cadherin-23 [Ischnura elegans]|uniref:cadherin-23 n=1 Tax=Ischnura elegans TaxID=197161 RepID=UPI001ED8B9B7|nr:cadherin-23 [Ischnura elegans]